ncbi:Rieske iron-sulfur protein [Pseudomonas sp. NBRC 100443]|nr:Rieske iron-sulfur protein [Pseudomonas sp. NBRC 100443]
MSGKKPLAVRCGQHEIVLFRDAAGQVRALEDRCPHRRAPLSLGRIRAEGTLQCGYHGWTFDGSSGQCVQIPNLSADERVPPKHKVEPYPVCERDGLVYVWVAGNGQAPSAEPAALPFGASDDAHGSLSLSLNHEQFAAALLDGPEVILRLTGMRITDHLLGDPKWRNGCWVSERGMMWAGPTLPARFVRDYPLILKVSVTPANGLCQVEVLNQDEELLASAILASAPGARGTTALRWRSRRHAAAGWRVRLARVLERFHYGPIEPLPHVDGSALGQLLEGPSRVLRAPQLIVSSAEQLAS